MESWNNECAGLRIFIDRMVKNGSSIPATNKETKKNPTGSLVRRKYQWSDFSEQIGLVLIHAELGSDFFCEHAHTHHLIALLLGDPLLLLFELFRELGLLSL